MLFELGRWLHIMFNRAKKYLCLQRVYAFAVDRTLDNLMTIIIDSVVTFVLFSKSILHLPVISLAVGPSTRCGMQLVSTRSYRLQLNCLSGLTRCVPTSLAHSYMNDALCEHSSRAGMNGHRFKAEKRENGSSWRMWSTTSVAAKVQVFERVKAFC